MAFPHHNSLKKMVPWRRGEACGCIPQQMAISKGGDLGWILNNTENVTGVNREQIQETALDWGKCRKLVVKRTDPQPPG